MSCEWLQNMAVLTHTKLRAFSKLLFIFVGCLVIYYTLRFYHPWNVNFDPIQSFGTPSSDLRASDKSVILPENPSNVSSAHSVLVFLHMQKTGGTLVERGLVKNGLIKRSCICAKGKRRCACKTPSGDTWLVSRFSTGWICGLHADLTEYTECLDSALNVLDERFTKRRYVFFTILRNPLDRYLSEWLHVRRGGTWHFARLHCAGYNYSPTHRTNKLATDAVANTKFYRPCYTIAEFRLPPTAVDLTERITSRTDHPDWAHVPLDTFIACPYNLAHNRQTRMLADLTRLGCYRYLVNWSIPLNQADRDSIRLQRNLRASAKHSLLTRIRVFGLSEYIVYTQYVYQRSLNFTFRQLLSGTTELPPPAHRATHASLIRAALNSSELQAIESRIQLDRELYRFARSLFTRRLTVYLIGDLSVPYGLRRSLRTLYYHQPSLWLGLEYLLLGGSPSSPGPFATRLQQSLIRRFMRQGSIPLTGHDTEFVRDKWVDKLASDFENAGLLPAITGSLLNEESVHDEEEDDGDGV